MSFRIAPMEPHKPCVFGGNERAAVWGECQGVNLSNAPAEGQQLLPGERVPEPYRLRLTGCRERIAIRGERECTHLLVISVDHQAGGLRGHVPQGYIAVLVSRGHGQAVGRE